MSNTGWTTGGETQQEILERRRKEAEELKRDIEDIDEQINWGYAQMRIVEAWLEEVIERNEAALSEKDQKRIDKALVVTRTGLKMLKKVVKSRAPYLDTASWRRDVMETRQ
jgi:phytoene/squalene synthetase